MSDAEARAVVLALRARRCGAAVKWALVPALMAVASPLVFGLFSLHNLGNLVASALIAVATALVAVLTTLSRRLENEVVLIRAFGDEEALSSAPEAES